MHCFVADLTAFTAVKEFWKWFRCDEIIACFFRQFACMSHNSCERLMSICDDCCCRFSQSARSWCDWGSPSAYTVNVPRLHHGSVVMSQQGLSQPLFLLSVCVCVIQYMKSLLTWYLRNLSWEFHQIYNFGAVGEKDELIRFWGQKVKGQGHRQHFLKMCFSSRDMLMSGLLLKIVQLYFIFSRFLLAFVHSCAWLICLQFL